MATASLIPPSVEVESTALDTRGMTLTKARELSSQVEVVAWAELNGVGERDLLGLGQVDMGR